MALEIRTGSYDKASGFLAWQDHGQLRTREVFNKQLKNKIQVPLRHQYLPSA